MVRWVTNREGIPLPWQWVRHQVTVFTSYTSKCALNCLQENAWDFQEPGTLPICLNEVEYGSRKDLEVVIYSPPTLFVCGLSIIIHLSFKTSTGVSVRCTKSKLFHLETTRHKQLSEMEIEFDFLHGDKFSVITWFYSYVLEIKTLAYLSKIDKVANQVVVND